MMRKMMTLLLALLLVSTGGGLAQAAEQIQTVEPTPDAMGLQAGTELVVATTTELSGYFATELFGGNTADMDVRALLNGYSTVAWTRDQGMALDNAVVKDVRMEQAADGSRTYTLTLADGLCYNDGTPITARDYVFSLLLSGSPLIAELGGTPQGLEHIAGYRAYVEGRRPALSGLGLISDAEFSLQTGSAYEDYFYGLAMLQASPLPMHVIAPDCAVRDDGDGAYIAGPFDAALLETTLLDPETGYVFNPRVTSGPYQLETVDLAAGEARFTVNGRYAGNYEGQKPHIERLVLRPASAGTMMRQLQDGEIGLINKVTGELAIGDGLALVHELGLAQVDNYLRTGFAFLSFACEGGVTSRVAVRQAVARLIDAGAFAASAVGSASALPVNGYYGLGQWMTVQVFEAEDGLDELNVPNELAALELPYDPDAAGRLLDEDGWTLNASGGAYVPGVDAVRYREQDGALVPLVIRWAKSEASPIADALERALEAPFAAVGIGLEVTALPFPEMLRHYYRQVERGYDMFFLANNFGYVFDPYYDFNVGDAYQGAVNATGLKDEALMELARSMSATHPTAIRAYTEKWLAFQRRFVEQMPMVPLYSNVYFDFFGDEVQGYEIQPHTGWAQAILYTWISDPEMGDMTKTDEHIAILG